MRLRVVFLVGALVWGFCSTFLCAEFRAGIAATIKPAVGKLEPVGLRVASGVARGRIAYNYYAPDLFGGKLLVILYALSA